VQSDLSVHNMRLVQMEYCREEGRGGGVEVGEMSRLCVAWSELEEEWDRDVVLMYMYTYTYTYIYIYMHVCLYICTIYAITGDMMHTFGGKLENWRGALRI